MRPFDPSHPPTTLPSPGDAGRQRLRLRRSLTAQAVYLLCIGMQWIDVAFGWTSATTAAWFSAFMVAGNLGFLLAIRSGWNLRFAEPALTLPQMLFALLSLGLAYAINPHVRGALLAVVALVLVFGAFTLPAAQCRRLGWVAIAVVGAAMLWGQLARPEAFPIREELLHALIAAAVLPMMGLLAGELSKLRNAQKQQKRELRSALRRLQEVALQDTLTGLPNRRRVQQWFVQETARSRRTRAPLSVALIDLDHFKRVNDEFGHATGDEVLRRFAREAGALLRSSDLLARWGGEEFLVLMPDTSAEAAAALMARLRAHLDAGAVWRDLLPRRIGFSAGVTEWVEDETLEAWVSRADAALYEAKGSGRDRVVTV